MYNVLDIKTLDKRVEQLEGIAENLGKGKPVPILLSPEVERAEQFNYFTFRFSVAPELAGTYRVAAALFGFEGEAISGACFARIKGQETTQRQIPIEINNIQNGELIIDVGLHTLEPYEELEYMVGDVIIPMTVSCVFYLYPES